MSASELDSPRGFPPPAWTAPDGWLQSTGCRLAAYMPLEGLVAGRKVLDVDGVQAGQERLRRAGARTVFGVSAPPWQVPHGSIDAVFVLDAGQSADPVLLAEVNRVLSPDGFLALRLVVDATLPRGELAARLSKVFPAVELINQVPIAGFTFDRGSSREVVVAEDLFPTGAAPSHMLALCGKGGERPWNALESWVVPLANPRISASAPPLPDERAAWEQRLKELTQEREYLREAVMTLQDERDRLERLATNLRRDADRNLARMSDQAAALEVLGLERDHAMRRSQERLQQVSGSALSEPPGAPVGGTGSADGISRPRHA